MSEYKNEETASWSTDRVRREAGQTPTRPPERPAQQHRRRRHRFLSGWRYALFVLTVSAVLAGTGWLLINDFCALNKSRAETTVEVTSEDTLDSIADKLHDAGLVKYKWFFKLVGSMSGASDKIGIGSYSLDSSMDYLALINGMRNASGNLNADTVRVTIPEGYTVAQTIALLSSKGVNTEEALTEAAKTAVFDYSFIDADSQEPERLEGYLFPDTYDFYLNEKPSSALNRLLKNFSSKVSGLDAEVEATGYSLEKVIIMASLVEKETDGADQATIASVIFNRLNDSGSHGTYKLLQIDAALLYALPDHEGAITAADKNTDSPYNLYKNAGLPPTAIANPGMDAINGVLHAPATDYYYYALGKDGVHHFFATYNEHLNFVNSDQYGG